MHVKVSKLHPKNKTRNLPQQLICSNISKMVTMFELLMILLINFWLADRLTNKLCPLHHKFTTFYPVSEVKTLKRLCSMKRHRRRSDLPNLVISLPLNCSRYSLPLMKTTLSGNHNWKGVETNKTNITWTFHCGFLMRITQWASETVIPVSLSCINTFPVTLLPIQPAVLLK